MNKNRKKMNIHLTFKCLSNKSFNIKSLSRLDVLHLVSDV